VDDFTCKELKTKRDDASKLPYQSRNMKRPFDSIYMALTKNPHKNIKGIRE
jgi:hypothetical protein